MFHKTLLLCCIVAVATAQETRLLRQPDISNSQIVFAYANDLWIVAKLVEMPIDLRVIKALNQMQSFHLTERR